MVSQDKRNTIRIMENKTSKLLFRMKLNLLVNGVLTAAPSFKGVKETLGKVSASVN